MAASGTRSLVFIADVIADSSSRMSCEVYMAIAPAPRQPAAKLARWLFTVGLKTDPKCTTEVTQELPNQRNVMLLNGWVSHRTSTQPSMFLI